MDPLVKPEDDEIFGEADELEGAEADGNWESEADELVESGITDEVEHLSLEFSFLINFCTSS